MRHVIGVGAALVVAASFGVAHAQPMQSKDAKIAEALKPLPEDLKAGATVVSYDARGFPQSTVSAGLPTGDLTSIQVTSSYGLQGELRTLVTSGKRGQSSLALGSFQLLRDARGRVRSLRDTSTSLAAQAAPSELAGATIYDAFGRLESVRLGEATGADR